MMNPPKKMAQLIINRMKPDYVQKLGDKPMGMAEGGEVPKDDSVALESAAREMIQAVKEDSPKRMVSAMKNFMDICEASEPEDYAPEASE